MNIGKACAIFKDIRSDRYSLEEKGTAILAVTKMPTHNSIYKENMLEVIDWLLRLAFTVDGEERDGKNAWIIDECDSTDETPSRAWIEFHCPNCGSSFELEEGQYGWYAPESEIPFRLCPICGLPITDRGGLKDE